jgi:hypothetical protein
LSSWVCQPKKPVPSYSTTIFRFRFFAINETGPGVGPPAPNRPPVFEWSGDQAIS